MKFTLLTKGHRLDSPFHIKRRALRILIPFRTADLVPFAVTCFVPLMVQAGALEKSQAALCEAKPAQTVAPGRAYSRSAENISQSQTSSTMSMHPYLGTWVTDDGHVRHQLLPGGRYDEARGQKESAYRGRYEITGNHIDYHDDTGFTADGDFVDGVLYHGGMVLRKIGRDRGAGSPRASD